MMFRPALGKPYGASHSVCLLLVVLILSSMSATALPKRLILALDGVAYRDMQALQQGVTYKDRKGREFHRQAFTNFFPVSRMVSTFPSTSDVAWTDMLGDRPLPGYQRTYFCAALNREFFDNGISSTMEYEHQMSWQLDGSFRRAMGYVFPVTAFKIELGEMADNFLNSKSQEANYYAYLRSTDDAQHLSGNIFAMLARVEETLKDIRARYKAREGHDLEVLILSDHGNNHAGPPSASRSARFWTRAGYRLSQSIKNPKDVVLPTAGMESWVEIHNSPAATENLVKLLARLEGVDLVTAQALASPTGSL